MPGLRDAKRSPCHTNESTKLESCCHEFQLCLSMYFSVCDCHFVIKKKSVNLNFLLCPQSCTRCSWRTSWCCCRSRTSGWSSSATARTWRAPPTPSTSSAPSSSSTRCWCALWPQVSYHIDAIILLVSLTKMAAL